MGDGEKLLKHLNSALKVLLGLDIFLRVPNKKVKFSMCKYIYIYIYMCVCVCVYVSMCVYIYVYIYIYVCVCMYTHTHIFECVETVYESPLLPNNIVSETFLHKIRSSAKC